MDRQVLHDATSPLRATENEPAIVDAAWLSSVNVDYPTTQYQRSAARDLRHGCLDLHLGGSLDRGRGPLIVTPC